MPGAPPALAVRAIQEAVCVRFGLDRRDLLSRRRKKRLVRARQAAYWLARRAGHSYPAIARAFGDRDHTTVMYGVSRADEMLAEDPDYAAVVEGILRLVFGA